MTGRSGLSPYGIAEVLSRVARAAHPSAFAHGLNPAQWTALRYFAHATPEARHLTAFSHYHGTGKGTASQTIAALKRKGLLKAAPDQKDRRMIRLDITGKGKATLAHDPLLLLSRAIEDLGPEEQMTLALLLEQLMRRLHPLPQGKGKGTGARVHNAPSVTS